MIFAGDERHEPKTIRPLDRSQRFDSNKDQSPSSQPEIRQLEAAGTASEMGEGQGGEEISRSSLNLTVQL
jgi:hypothetical protein